MLSNGMQAVFACDEKGPASMSVVIADRSRLSWLALRRRFSNLKARLKVHWVAGLVYWVAPSERLVIAPQELRTSDPTRAGEIYAGRFAFAGKVVVCDGRSPFEMEPPSDEWAEMLLGFGWLRHLRAADSTINRANARALVDEWITLQGSWHAVGWQPEIVARRVISWLCQSPVILHDADLRFYRRFLKTLTRQVRYLRGTANDTRDGVPRLQARIALVYAVLCMAKQINHLRGATRRLVNELERQILPDGGHISRNPGVIIEVLLDLLPLSQAFTARNVAPPPALINAIDRMMPMLRFFRHGDGTFGLFNGMGPTPPDLLATVLAYDDARGTPVANAPYSGYQRIDGGATVVLMDTGGPPPAEVSADAHAGCLAFEFSAKQQRIVVNCGMPGNSKENWRQVARATAAHSTVTFNDTSSCRFLDSIAFRRLFGVPIVEGPENVTVSREAEGETTILRAAHDGYAECFGIIHERFVSLSDDGNKLDGEDIFLPATGNSLPEDALDHFAVRFHLHPSIRANRLTDGHGAVLLLPNKDVWNLHSHEDEVVLEESVYLAGNDGPRRTTQVVIYGRAREFHRVHWTFSHVPHLAPGAKRPRGPEPELPL
jgi:uncharacterized heparinase superfamily protein